METRSRPFGTAADAANVDERATLEHRANLVRVILDAVPGGVIHVALDGSVVEANAEAIRLLGYRFDELTHRFTMSLETTALREDGSPYPISEYPATKVLATGEPQAPITIGVRRPNGETFWAVFRAVPARDTAGTLTGAVVSFIDITERKRAEEELRRSEAKWRSLVENLPDCVLIMDREGRIEWVSRSLPDLEHQQFIGTPSHAYVAPNYLDEWVARFAAVLETRAVTRFETRGFGRRGPSVWYETTLVPIVEAPDVPVERVLLLVRDITERREMIAGLAEKERLASIGMLSASVAHEIMNPLTYVLANLDFALSERCPPGARKTKALIDARDGAGRMQQIVWDLRALGRTGSEELFYVDVRSVIETALRLAGPEVAKNVRVSVELTEVPGVLASESRLCQVFINLLINAGHAMADLPTGERSIRIRTRSDEGANLVGVEVSDTGIGIEAENMGRIFDPFFTTKATGTGIGLSIAKEHIERMGGRIAVESEPGRGTTFTVWLSTTRVLPPRAEASAPRCGSR
ncbi:MAG: hypothetical protein BGO98_45140 [Myxococcales bacterium 68-20]|nr:MAG: hypothetical protein BGO98_45140 [Myxococcales bacterium 68-20]